MAGSQLLESTDRCIADVCSVVCWNACACLFLSVSVCFEFGVFNHQVSLLCGAADAGNTPDFIL